MIENEKANNIETYFNSVCTFYRFLASKIFEFDDHNKEIKYEKEILESDNAEYVKVALISYILTVTKEDIVDKEAGLSYSSKLFDNSLETTVKEIATEKDGKYIIDDYAAANAAELLAKLRNKFSHGDYLVDAKNKLVSFNIENNMVDIPIEKLSTFIIKAYQNLIKDTKGSETSRNIFTINEPITSANPIKTSSDLKGVLKKIRNFEYIVKKIEGHQDEIIDVKTKNEFFDYIQNMASSNNYIKKEATARINNILKNQNCMLETKTRKLKTDDIEVLKSLLNNIGGDFYKYNYAQQCKALLDVCQPYINPQYKTESLKTSAIYSLMFVYTMKRINSTDLNDLMKVYGVDIIKIDNFSYANSAIIMFNTLFSYMLDDVYKEFDYSKLIFEGFNLNIINDKPEQIELKRKESEAKERVAKQCEENLEKTVHSLKTVLESKKTDAIAALSRTKEIYEKKLAEAKQNEITVKNQYLNMVEDYKNNRSYYTNKTIINCIRNSIAHGNISISSESDTALDNSFITFTDYDKGVKMFELKVSISNFLNLFCPHNYDIIFNYIGDIKKTDKRVL